MRPPIPFALVAGLLTLGCGQNNLASKLKPADPNAADALGGVACNGVGEVGEPYVVDLRGTERSHLEATMGEGIALVRYDCNGLEILKGCTVRGADPYDFVAFSLKEDQVQIENADELRANLPASAIKLEGELSSGSTIDIGLVMVGKRSTTTQTVTTADLEGPGCDKATHFVNQAIVGAFAVDKGTRGKARVAAEIFGAGVGAGSEANKNMANRDGDPEDCTNVKPGDSVMPDACRSAISVLLYPIVDEAPVIAETEEGDKSDDDKPKALEVTCPPGFVRSAGKCAPKSRVSSYECKPGKKEDCAKQCTAGNAGSCYNLAVMTQDPDERRRLYERACADEHGPARACTGAAFTYGFGDGRNPKKYESYLEQGCDRGDSNACSSLGSAYIAGFSGVSKNVKEGIDLLERACGMGNKGACSRLGIELARTGVDPQRGIGLLDRSCSSGNAMDCNNAANLFIAAGPVGQGMVKKDMSKAVEYLVKACDLASTSSCERAGTLLAEGKGGVRRNNGKAQGLYEKGCPPPPPPTPPKPGERRAYPNDRACTGLGKMLVKKAPRKAEEVWKRGCDPNKFRSDSCSSLAALYLRGAKGVKKDPPGAESILRAACDKRNQASCTELGKLLESSDKGIAKAFYGEKCSETKMRDMCTAFQRLGGRL